MKTKAFNQHGKQVSVYVPSKEEDEQDDEYYFEAKVVSTPNVPVSKLPVKARRSK